MLRLAHVGPFAAAVVGCLVALRRAGAIPHADTRTGLVGLLATSSIWAAAQIVTFLPVSLPVATLFYEVGLIAGLASVGAWLYFCSAYTGQTFHRTPAYRYAAVVVFLGITSVKLTNTLHGWYFTIEMATTPFRYPSIDLLGLHWAVAALAYSLTAVGFYMLVQLFAESHIRTTALGALIGLTTVPVVLNVLGTLGFPGLVANNYEPLGVAAFALGALYLAEDSFEQVRWASHQQLLDTVDEAVIVVDDDGTIREFNSTAVRLFDRVAAGENLLAAVPELDADAETATRDPPAGASTGPPTAETVGVLSAERAGEERYFLVKERPLTIGPANSGRVLVISDVTTVERQRRNLQQQSEALEGFSAAVAHELRNTLAIVSGNVDLMAGTAGTDDPELTAELLGQMGETTDRMMEIVDDLVALTRLSQPVSDPSVLDFRRTVERAASAVETDAVPVHVQGDGRIHGDRKRVHELVQNAVRLAAETDSSRLTVELTPEGFDLRMDGPSLDEGDAAALLQYGAAVPHSEAGMLGPNIRTLATAHDWDVSVTDLGAAGVEIVITGAVVELDGPVEPGAAA